MSLETLLFVGVVALATLVAVLLMRGRRKRDPEEAAERKRSPRGEDIDTVAAWPPEATRLLTSGERAAHEVLVKALPECMIFAQVPLQRFIKVPRRHSYADWLTRVGHLCADFLLCDRASMVIGAVLLQTARDSERSERRRTRMSRVLKAAGLKVFVWREDALPDAQKARDQILQRVGEIKPAAPLEPIAARPVQPPATDARGVPIPEVVALDDGPRREPPPSTWFDDLDSGRVPLDPARRQPGNG
jgi:Protein of unknown function (DUF2726)